MAKIISVDAFDIITQKSVIKHINADNVIELEDLSFNNQPLTRLKMSNGSYVDILKTIADVTKIINS